MEMIRMRASSIGDFVDCAARWYAKYIDGKRMPTSSAAQLGTAVHAGTALYDQSVMDGKGLTIDETAGAVVDTLQHPDHDVDWGDDNVSELEKIGIALHELYCSKISPTQEYVAVEANCQALDIEDIGLSLTGSTDRIYKIGEDYGIADIKTGKSIVGTDGAVATAGHATQMAVYELLASAALDVTISAPARIIGLQVAKTARGRRAAVGEIRGAADMLLGDERQKGLLTMISDSLHSGRIWGNPRSRLCNEKYCPVYATCRWRA